MRWVFHNLLPSCVMSLRSRVAERAEELLAYCRKEGYNCKIALFVDLSRHSGRRRFVVWDFVAKKAILCAPVSHGSGSQLSRQRSAYARLSNIDGSHLSSSGRALVAERYEGRYGVAYRLDGLDESNSLLRSRSVVLHGWEHTTSFPIWPLATVGSFGCPVLSQKMMSRVDDLIKNESKVVLLSFV